LDHGLNLSGFSLLGQQGGDIPEGEIWLDLGSHSFGSRSCQGFYELMDRYKSEEVVEMAAQHHESVDGKGHPHTLAEDKIS
jgi:hypothetical protein